MGSYHTGANNNNAANQATGVTVTVPSDVSIDDYALVIVEIFTWAANTNADTILCSTASGHTWSAVGPKQTSSDGTLKIIGQMFGRKITSGDASDVLTFKTNGTSLVNDQFWYGVSLAAYTGFPGGVDVVATKNNDGNTGTANPLTWPSVATTQNGDWAIYTGLGAMGNSGNYTGTSIATATARQGSWNAGINSKIADSNGSVGNSGTTIGGSSVNIDTTGSVGSESWYALFTIGLSTVSPAITGTGAVKMKKMKIAIQARLPGTGAIKMKKMRISATGTAPLRGTGAIKMKKMKLAGTGSQPDILAVFNNTTSGIDNYTITSPFNGPNPTSFRVLQPTSPAAGYPHAFVYSLPVAADGNTGFGEGLDTIKTGGWHNAYNITVVEPQFNIDPWFADHPTNPNYRFETFMVKLKDWVVTHLASTGVEKHILIGFSKSGIGGQGLILNNPTVFDKCISWDFPTDGDMTTRFSGNADVNYGTSAAFNARYDLGDTNLARWKTPFQGTNRLWIGAFALYGGDVSDYHARLNTASMLHTYPTPVSRTHDWNSGWVGPALADVMVLQSTGSGGVRMKKMRIGGTAHAPLLGTGAIKMKKMRLSSSGKLTVSGTGAIRMKKMRIKTPTPQGGTGISSSLLVFTEV